jgi:Uncharacterized conserved protein
MITNNMVCRAMLFLALHTAANPCANITSNNTGNIKTIQKSLRQATHLHAVERRCYDKSLSIRKWEYQEHNSSVNGKLYIGCPMWGYKNWVGSFFAPHTPQSDFLRLYSRRLTTVEGNTVFYALPSAETIQHWIRQTPADFRFCPKVSRTISHATDITQHDSEVKMFCQRMRLFGERLGPIFLQLPPTFSPTQSEQLQSFLGHWPADLRLAVEVRHADFFKEPYATQLNTLLKQHNVGRVLLDTRPIRIGPMQEQRELQARERKPHLPLQLHVSSDFVFLRYIGHPRMEVNEPLLKHWALQLAQWYREGYTLYIFCHCPFEEHSPYICHKLYSYLREETPTLSLPPLSWQPEEDTHNPEQMQLF